MITITQVAQTIPFDNSTNDFTSDTVQEALEEVIILSSRFSYKYIVPGKTIVIPENQEMLVKQKITVKGQLIVQGELVIL